MSGYEIRKTNGEVLVSNLADNTTSVQGGITLIGRNSNDYGDALNENLVKILESFSNSSPPGSGLIGQLWYDSFNQQLKVKFQDINPALDNIQDWKPVGGATVGTTQPTTPAAGDLWYDTNTGINQLKIFDGATYQVIGPEIVGTAGVTGLFVDTIVDTSSVVHDVIKLVINSVDTIIISNTQFTPASLAGFNFPIVPGLNFRTNTEIGQIKTSTLSIENSGIIPLTTEVTNLGSPSKKYANVYSTTFHGALNGNATSATTTSTATTSGSTSTVAVATTALNNSFYPTFVNATTGNLAIRVDGELTYNPSTNVLTVPNINYGGQITSSVSSGTAPFVVSSTTRVDNLHVATAGVLFPGKTIALTGDVTATGVTFTGESNISLSTTIPDNSINLAAKATTGSNYVATITGAPSGGITVTGSGRAAAVTLSIGQSVTPSSSPQFAGLRVLGVDHVNALSVGSAITSPSTTPDGEIRVQGEITAFVGSDLALKENIVPIANPLDLVKRLRGVYFDWRDDHIANRGGEDGYFVRKKDMGIIAQDVEAVFPEIVARRTDGTLAVKYDRLVSVLIEAVKDLTDKVKDLENRLDKKN